MNIGRHGRVYRALLRTYPLPFRARFADAMTEAFERAVEEACQTGFLAVALLWGKALYDIVTLGLGARLFPRRRHSPPPRRDSAGHLKRDLRDAVRRCTREPGMSAAIVLALAIGIGLTGAAFSIVYGAVWRSLPFERPDRLVHLERARPAEDVRTLAVTYHDYREWRAAQTSFEDLGAYVEAILHLTDGAASAERQYGVSVSPASFSLLRVRPFLGRLFVESDTLVGNEPVVLLGYELWHRRYGGDSMLVDRHIQINGEATRVVGVMPPRFGFPVSESMWLPLRLDPAVPRGGGRLDVFGRLRDDVSVEEARAEFGLLSRRLAATYTENEGIEARLSTFREEYVGDDFIRTIYTMLAGAVLVLLVACANVVNLLLARTTRRSRELAVRSALGAGRRQLVSLLLAETGVLAALGGGLGLGIAHVGIRWFEWAWIDQGALDLPHGSAALFWWDFRIDLIPLLFVLGVTVSAALLTAAVPGVRASRQHVADELKDEARSTSSFRGGRLTRALVIAEVALSSALLTATAVTVRSVINASRVGASVLTTDVVTARLSLPDRRLGMNDANYPNGTARLRFWTALAEQLERSPGVRHAAITSSLPVTQSGLAFIRNPGSGVVEPLSARRVVISAAFFDVYNVAALEGRLFDDRDRAGSPQVAVVNASFVRRFFPNRSPVFQRLIVGGRSGEIEVAVVGVVPDMWVDGERNRQPAGVYLPLAQSLDGSLEARLGPWGLTFMALAVRAEPSASDLGRAINGAVATVDPMVPVYNLRPMHDVVSRATGQFRVYGQFYAVVGGLGLLLALLGLYGVLAFVVTGRRFELGIRLALGAGTGTLVRSIVAQGVMQVATGLVVGLILGLWLTRGLERVLYAVEPWDPVAFAVVAILFVVTGALASLLPARRAASVDAVEVLRA